MKKLNSSARIKVNTTIRNLLKESDLTTEEVLAKVAKQYKLSNADLNLITQLEPVKSFLIEARQTEETLDYDIEILPGGEIKKTLIKPTETKTDKEEIEPIQEEPKKIVSVSADPNEGGFIVPKEVAEELVLDTTVEKPKLVVEDSFAAACALQNMPYNDFIKLLATNLSGDLHQTFETVATRYGYSKMAIQTKAENLCINYAKVNAYRATHYRQIVSDTENECSLSQFSYPTISEPDNAPLEGESVNYEYNYFRQKLGLSSSLSHNVDILYEFYKQRINPKEEENRIKETLYEYIRLFEERGLDGADIVADRIAMVSRKSSNTKHNITYLIGCLRNNLENGMSSTNSESDNKIIAAFENQFGIKLSNAGKGKVLGMVVRHGSVNTLLGLINSKDTLSVEDYYLGKVTEAVLSI